MSPKRDVMIAFAHNGSVAMCFMNSVMDVLMHDANHNQRIAQYHEGGGPYIHDNRSRIARYFLNDTDMEWLWFLDNDMKFEADALDKLLAAAEKDDLKIVGGAYWNKYGDSGTYLSWLVFTDEGVKAIDCLPPTDDPLEVSAVGMGCTLIHRDVLTDVADMHADDPWDTFGADVLKWEDGRQERMGEDVTLCFRARKCGYLTYGLPSVIAEHYKPHYMMHGDRERALVG